MPSFICTPSSRFTYGLLPELSAHGTSNGDKAGIASSENSAYFFVDVDVAD